MFSKTLSIAAVALAASAVVDAQTFTSCNPLKKSKILLSETSLVDINGKRPQN